MTEEQLHPLKAFQPQHSFLIAVDSDGSVFDTMELKQKECIIPVTIRHWHLQAISRYARQTAEFVGLYSKWRGTNRFNALLKVFDLLRQRPEVRKRKVEMPLLQPLRDWVRRETRLSNQSLRTEAERTGDPILKQTLQWSLAVNAAIEAMVQGIPSFPGARESLEKARQAADLVVLSSTPLEALHREWNEHGMTPLVRMIAGQEMGNKEEQLAWVTNGKYAPDCILMIGDSPGDLRAAQAIGALFYPIDPGAEEVSWERFHEEALQRFLTRTFAGSYQENLIKDFERLLPAVPPWQQ